MREAKVKCSFQDLPGGTATFTSSSEALCMMNSVDVTTFGLEMRVWF